MNTWLFPAACVFTLPVVAAMNVGQSGPTGPLLTRAGDYIRRVEETMSTVVLEERYVQVIKTWTLPPERPDEKHLAWAEDLSRVRPDVIVAERRQTRSDLLLVQVPDRRWTAFRDTFEVNGRPQRNREDRLRRLFLTQTEDSRRQLRRIHEQSADWNLGGFYREVNLPTTGLLVLHPAHQHRFAFEAGAIAPAAGTACRLVSFKETAKPTIVRSIGEKDVPLSGDACIDERGAVWHTRLVLDPRYTARGVIEVTYRREERLDVLVPIRMWEWYLLPDAGRNGLPAYLEAMATYSNLRQFTVTTSEQVK